MKLHLNVNKDTFERVVSGEQDELFMKHDDHWARKLYHRRIFGKFANIQSVTISNRSGGEQRVITAKVLYISIKKGRPEYGLPEEQMFYIKIAEPVKLEPPYNSFLVGPGTRNRIK